VVLRRLAYWDLFCILLQFEIQMTLSYIDVFVTAKIKNFWRMDRELG